jgi:CheY-like chemotaxis protein
VFYGVFYPLEIEALGDVNRIVPILRSAARQDAQQLGQVTGGMAHGLRGGGSGETILMVEAARRVRLAGSRMLADLGYRVLTTADPEEALALIEGDARIDLLFTDIMLRGALRGDELAVVARQLRPDIRVLCTLGSSEIRLADPATGEGWFGLIAKPFSKPDLARQLRQVLHAKAVPA